MSVGPGLPLFAAVVVAAVHTVAARVRAVAPLPHRLWLSGAGGVSIAYVFVHVLPELQAGQETFAETEVSLGGVVPYLEHHVYLVALVGFAGYYGVERFARRGRDERDGDGADEDNANDGSDAEGAPFRLHLGSFALYNGLIGYFLVHRIESDVRGLAVFTGAMALHAFVTDAGLDRHHGAAYRRYGRWVLAASVLAGWAVARVVELHELAVATLFAFLAGGIVLNVVKEELPEERGSSFAAFVAGAAGYAALLLLV